MAILRFRTQPIYDQPNLRVDREAGIIRDVTVVRQGEARGHGVWVDGEFVSDVVTRGNAFPAGLKSRFNHPNACSGSFGSMVGTLQNFRATDGLQSAIADLHVSPAASVSPDGDLAKYLYSMAENHPDHFGLSVDFASDGIDYVYDTDGNKVEYVPGDTDTDLKHYLRLLDLKAADVVDDPAATDGLFSAQFHSDHFAVRVTEWLDDNPEIFEWAARHPDLISKFFKTYSEYRSRKVTGTKAHSAMKKKSFFARLLDWFDTKQFNVDLTDTDGNLLRVMTDADTPAAGDPLVIVPPDGSEPAAAPDGNYTVNGGDFDGAVITALDGLISDFQPSNPDAQVTDAPAPGGQMSADDLSVKFSELQTELGKAQKLIAMQQERITALERSPAGAHTDGDADADMTGGSSIFDTPWNQQADKMYEQSRAAAQQMAERQPKT